MVHPFPKASKKSLEVKFLFGPLNALGFGWHCCCWRLHIAVQLWSSKPSVTEEKQTQSNKLLYPSQLHVYLSIWKFQGEGIECCYGQWIIIYCHNEVTFRNLLQSKHCGTLLRAIVQHVVAKWRSLYDLVSAFPIPTTGCRPLGGSSLSSAWACRCSSAWALWLGPTRGTRTEMQGKTNIHPWRTWTSAACIGFPDEMFQWLLVPAHRVSIQAVKPSEWLSTPPVTKQNRVPPLLWPSRGLSAAHRAPPAIPDRTTNKHHHPER